MYIYTRARDHSLYRAELRGSRALYCFPRETARHAFEWYTHIHSLRRLAQLFFATRLSWKNSSSRSISINHNVISPRVSHSYVILGSRGTRGACVPLIESYIWQTRFGQVTIASWKFARRPVSHGSFVSMSRLFYFASKTHHAGSTDFDLSPILDFKTLILGSWSATSKTLQGTGNWENF